MTDYKYSINAKNVNKTFYKGSKKINALIDFDLQIKKGSIHGLLGPNGAGKSTFINILGGLVKKNSGLVSVTRQSDETLWKIRVKNNKVFNDIGKNFAKRSQDLKKIYKPNGAIFIFNLKKLKHKKQFDVSKGFQTYEMDRLSSIDIDDNYDFTLVDLILKTRK